MKVVPTRIVHRLQLAVLTMLLSSSCTIKGSSSSCSAGQAQLTVYDTAISRDCGCAEGSGVFTQGSTNFVCTLTFGTTLYFIYNTSVDHDFQFGNGITPQIYTAGVSASSGAMTFPSTNSDVNFSDVGGTAISGYFVINPN